MPKLCHNGCIEHQLEPTTLRLLDDWICALKEGIIMKHQVNELSVLFCPTFSKSRSPQRSFHIQDGHIDVAFHFYAALLDENSNFFCLTGSSHIYNMIVVLLCFSLLSHFLLHSNSSLSAPQTVEGFLQSLSSDCTPCI